MSFYSVSHWETSDWTDEMESLAREKYIPLVMAVGAQSVNMVRTSADSFLVVTIYKDEGAADEAQAKIDAIRGEAASELPMKLVSVHRGNTFASN